MTPPTAPAPPSPDAAESGAAGDPTPAEPAMEGMEIALDVATPYADVAERDRLVARLLPLVGGWCSRLGGPTVDAEEAAHDVVMTVLRRIDDLRPGAPVEPWAFGITRRIVRAHRRRAWFRRWVPGLEVDVPDHRTPGRLMEQSQTAARVHSVLDRLPEMYREVIVLCDVEERSRHEVAAMLGLPEGTVKSRLRLGREQFRRLAAASGYDFASDGGENDG